jgi:hypothetical protein
MANEDLIASKPAPVLAQSLATMEIVHTEKNDTVSLRLLQVSLPVSFHHFLLLKIISSNFDISPTNWQLFA